MAPLDPLLGEVEAESEKYKATIFDVEEKQS